VFDQYWDYLVFLDQHLEFSRCSQSQQERMVAFSAGLGKFSIDPEFGPDVECDVMHKNRGEDAAFSRLRPIQDRKDYWQVIGEHRSSAGKG
jgi:hypothetical protein